MSTSPNRIWLWCLWLNERKGSIQFTKRWLYFVPGNKHRRCTVKKGMFYFTEEISMY